MENSVLESTAQSSKTDENQHLEEVTQLRKVPGIPFESDVIKVNETNFISVKSVTEAKLPLVVDEYENILISSREFNFNAKFK